MADNENKMCRTSAIITSRHRLSKHVHSHFCFRYMRMYAIVSMEYRICVSLLIASKSTQNTLYFRFWRLFICRAQQVAKNTRAQKINGEKCAHFEKITTNSFPLSLSLAICCVVNINSISRLRFVNGHTNFFLHDNQIKINILYGCRTIQMQIDLINKFMRSANVPSTQQLYGNLLRLFCDIQIQNQLECNSCRSFNMNAALEFVSIFGYSNGIILSRQPLAILIHSKFICLEMLN